MRGITNFFLRAKHWQVFVLIWGAYFVATVVLVATVPEGPIEHPLEVGLFSEVVLLPFILCSMGWMWSMGSFLYSIADHTLRPNVHFFRLAIILPTLYLLTGLPFFLSGNPTVEAVVVPIHLLALFCLIYAFYFVSKNLAVAEKGQTVTSNDYVLPLLLLFFSPIGVWLIQPRINRLYARRAG